MNFLIALSVNLAGMLLIYSLMAYALLRLKWHGGGIVPVLLTIIIAGIFWSAPTTLAFILDAKNADALPYSLWFGNWLVSGFSVIFLSQTVKGIPRQLEDAARLDGCGWIGIYRHALLPLVIRELGLIAFLTLMGTSVLCWMALTTPGSHHPIFPPWFSWLTPAFVDGESNPSLGRSVVEMIAGSLIVTLPMILVFFFSKRCYLRPVGNDN